MAPYFPITICRSDGVLEFVLNGKTVENAPQNTDATPNADGNVNFYKKLGENDEKAREWKAKLGGMMVEVLGDKDHAGKKFTLEEFPQGYVLWQHRKKSSQSTGGSKGSHAAGDLDRSDCYLFGHPGGRSKRFRSPQDFFPHLLWLATDVESNPDNCTCKLCYPTDKTVPEEQEKVQMSKNTVVKTEPSVAESGIALKPSLPPTVPRNLQSPEQKLDAEANGAYLYRPGELVWFNKGPAWGLAVICKRNNANLKPRYLLQPLSHPLHYPDSQIKDQESIRPWLAWSVPATTHAQIANIPYDQVPWERVVRGEFGRGDAEVDGSILAAKQIDGSYTLFERLDIPTASPDVVQYTGMFLGAEKIWVGEPVRVRSMNDEVVIMIIHQMIEKTTVSGSSVTIIGDLYKFVEMPTPYKDRKDWPTPDLPARVAADLRFRNEVSDNAKKGVWNEWRLLEPMARRGISDIKGRWYDTRTLLPVLRGMEAFQHEISLGNASDASLWMNSRGDSSNTVGQRKKNRLDTLGRAVPSDLKISRGLNGPPVDDIFPEERQLESVNRASAHDGTYGTVTQGDIDQFMNLDHGSVYDS